MIIQFDKSRIVISDKLARSWLRTGRAIEVGVVSGVPLLAFTCPRSFILDNIPRGVPPCAQRSVKLTGVDEGYIRLAKEIIK